MTFANGLIAVFRGLFRMLACIGPEERRQAYRDFNRKLDRQNEQMREFVRRVDENPGETLRHVKDLADSTSDPDMREILLDGFAPMQAMREESDRLQAIRAAAGDDAAAVRGYQDYVAEYPDSVFGYKYLAATLRKSGDLKGSQAAYEQALALAGETTLPGLFSRLHLAQLDAERGDHAQAVARLRSLIADAEGQRGSVDCFACFELGRVLRDSGDERGARQAWKQAVRRDPTGLMAKQVRELLRDKPPAEETASS